MRVGLIAYEFLPGIGGMQQFAEALANLLGARHDVTVFGRPGSERGDGRYQHAPLLTADLAIDGPLLQSHAVDVWLATNAGAAPLARTLREPLVLYIHGNDLLNPWIGRHRGWFKHVAALRGGWRFLPRLRQAIWRLDVKRALDRVPCILANSSYTASRLRAIHPAAGARCVVLPPGVGDRFFQPHAERQTETLRLLSVTRLTTAARRKNIDSVLRAVAMLPASQPVEYTIVGDGDDRGRLEALARDLGIADKTRFAGKVSSDDLRRIYAEADLFVLASEATTRDVEGFGIVYLEASAAGVPALLSRTGGATDAVQDGVNGVVVPDGSPESIRAGIERYVAMRHTFTPDRVRGVAEPFRWQAIVTRLEDHLRAAADTAVRVSR
jgi:phosphatidyl-myo-inositol dimannoside synthase